MNTYGHTGRLIRALPRRQNDARTSGTQHDRRDGHMQSVETPSRQKPRYRIGAAFDQNPAHANKRECGHDGRWCYVSILRRQSDNFDARRRRAAHPLGRDQQSTGTIIGEQPGACSEASPRIDDGARWLRTGHLPDRQLRIIRDGRPNTDDHNVDKRAQPVEMFDAGRTIDIFRMPGSGRDPTVERLAELAYDHQFVYATFAQWAEYICPNLREGLLFVTKQMNEVLPMIGRRKFLADGEIAKLHGRNQNRV